MFFINIKKILSVIIILSDSERYHYFKCTLGVIIIIKIFKND